ncbi:MAG: hypothetical protein VSS75_024755 [Candidatus Parabeggiatoa sp.]|nr:hypothetical protein [Candidatus Parabeggiatoa sp.]
MTNRSIPLSLTDNLNPKQKAHLINLLLQNSNIGYKSDELSCLPPWLEEHWSVLKEEPLSWAAAVTADLAWTHDGGRK